jgi:hypothetical protein
MPDDSKTASLAFDATLGQQSIEQLKPRLDALDTGKLARLNVDIEVAVIAALAVSMNRVYWRASRRSPPPRSKQGPEIPTSGPGEKPHPPAPSPVRRGGGAGEAGEASPPGPLSCTERGRSGRSLTPGPLLSGV